MIALTFTLHALEPLLITRLEGDPNSAVSYPYVPGSTLRGALIGRLAEDRRQRLALDNHDRRLFIDGSTRYLNAYPISGLPLLPRPLTWLCEKGTTTPVFDVCTQAAALNLPAAVKGDFCVLRDDKVVLIKPTWHINVHTARERVRGRATEAEGAVFRYQAMPRGTRLAGTILIDDEANAAELQELLEAGDLWLGGARSAGYGRTRVEEIGTAPWWPPVPLAVNDLQVGDAFVITLLSDAVLRTAEGSGADRVWPMHLPAPIEQAVKPGSIFKRLTLVGGFDRTWGLPLEQRRAVQAGSVFVFEVTDSIAAADLQRLCEQGIGDRRAEGFGQVAVNWHGQHAILQVCDLKELIGDRQPAADQQPIELRGDSARLAQRMTERWLRRQLDRQLAETVQGEACRVYHAPSKAQLSRLRSVTLSALPGGDVSRVQTFLSDEKLKARARDQFHLARIGRQRLLAWLRERVEKPESIWEQLAADQVQPPQIGSVSADWQADAKLRNEYTLRLIEAVLHRAGKEQ